MHKIQILGVGCPKCKALTENAERAVKDLGTDYTVEKITDIKEIMKFGIMTVPGLAVDGQVKAAGRVLTADEIKALVK